MTVIGNEPGKLERRTAERLDMEFNVEFQEVSESEADNLIELLGMQELELPEGAQELAHMPAGMGSSAKLGGQSAINVSATGVKIHGDFHLQSSRALERGTRLLVELYLPLKNTPLSMLAAVAWVAPKGDRAEMGLCFTAAKLEDLEKIEHLIEQKA